MTRNMLTEAIEAWRALSPTRREHILTDLAEGVADYTGAKDSRAEVYEVAFDLLRAAAEPGAKESHLVTVARLADALGVHPEADRAFDALMPKPGPSRPLRKTEPEAKVVQRRSAQAESRPSPKMNADEEQCDYCGRVYHESEVVNDACLDCRTPSGRRAP